MGKLTLANWNDRQPWWARRQAVRQAVTPAPEPAAARDDLDLIRTVLTSAVRALGYSDEVEVKLDIWYK